MRCWLTRPCIRLLWYFIIVVFMILFFTHGMVKLSQEKIRVTAVDFDNVISIYEEESAKHNKSPAYSGNRLGSRDRLKLYSEDYDTDGESLNEAYAKIDKDIREPTAEDSDESETQYSNTYIKDLVDDILNRRTTPDLLQQLKTTPGNNQSVNIIVNSYGIRKATVLDEMFINKREALVFYQPSLTLRSYWYLRGDNRVCSMKDSTCSSAGEKTSVLVLKCIVGLFQCSTEALAACLAPAGVVTHPDATKYNDCKKKARTKDETAMCLRMLRSLCTSAKIKIISVRNVALDVLEHVLKFTENLKIIHIFRDVRPVTYSGKAKAVNYLNSTGDVFYKRVQSLCERTEHDLDTALELQTKEHKDVFQMFAQEIIINDTTTKQVNLSAMLNMKWGSSKTVYDVIENSVRETIVKHRDIDKLWRLNMDIGTITVAHKICQNVYDRLGYRLF